MLTIWPALPPSTADCYLTCARVFTAFRIYQRRLNLQSPTPELYRPLLFILEKKMQGTNPMRQTMTSCVSGVFCNRIRTRPPSAFMCPPPPIPTISTQHHLCPCYTECLPGLPVPFILGRAQNPQNHYACVYAVISDTTPHNSSHIIHKT